MPTSMMHVAIAKKVNEKLALDADSLYIGCLLTNWTDIDYYKAHFKDKDTGLEGEPNPDAFLKKYMSKIKNPIVLGYLIHILTDRFWNKYMVSNVYLYNEEKEVIGVKTRRKKELALDEDSIYELKTKTYNRYDGYLISKNLTDVIKNINVEIPNLEEVVITKKELENRVNMYNEQVMEKKKKKLVFLVSNKNDLINQRDYAKNIERCANYIYGYLKKNGIIEVNNNLF